MQPEPFSAATNNTDTNLINLQCSNHWLYTNFNKILSERSRGINFPPDMFQIDVISKSSKLMKQMSGVFKSRKPGKFVQAGFNVCA